MKNLSGIIVFALILFSAGKLIAGENCNVHYGIELDAFPYITGGYYGSGWVSYDNIRFRLVVAKAKTPSFIINDGFENLNTKAYAAIIDYFPFDEHNELTGLWLGTGIEYWDNNVTNSSDKTTAGFYSYQYTLGGGYVIKIWKNLYINPWAAGHLRIVGDKAVNAGNKMFNVNSVLPEVSIKIGWQF